MVFLAIAHLFFRFNAEFTLSKDCGIKQKVMVKNVYIRIVIYI